MTEEPSAARIRVAGEQPAERDLGVLADKQLNINQQCAVLQQQSQIRSWAASTGVLLAGIET